MKKAIFLFVACALILGLGCKSSTAPDPEGLKGTWHATKAEFTSLANPSTKTEIIATGSTVTLVLNQTTAVLTITDPGESPTVLTANWSAGIDVLTLTWTNGWNGEMQFDYLLNGDKLTLEGGHIPFDFTPGNSEEAILNLELTRANSPQSTGARI